MITLALFEQMSSDNVAELTKNKDFFWEKMPLQSNGKPAQGVWLVTRGGDDSRSPSGLNLQTTVDVYVAFNNKVKTELVQEEILKYLLNKRYFCELSGTIDGKTYDYHNIRFRLVSTPQNDGVTENGLIVKVQSILVTYDLISI